MIDVLKQQLTEGMTYNMKLNTTKEFLQTLCLKIMNDKKMFDFATFLGGTALRIIHQARRFSEDLDFSSRHKAGIDLQSINNNFIKGFTRFGFDLTTKSKSTGAVKSILLKFPGLMKELELSDMTSQNITIKWDIDTNPPQGAVFEHSIVQKTVMMTVTHYDLPSLFTGKLHACLFRNYLKGRDWYDMVWYLTKKINPNIPFLNNAIAQTQGKSPDITHKSLKQLLLDKTKDLDFKKAAGDVKAFLEDENELSIFNKTAIQNLINNYFNS